MFLTTASLPVLVETAQQVTNELRKVRLPAKEHDCTSFVSFEKSDCKHQRESTREGQELFRLKRNFGLQTKNVN